MNLVATQIIGTDLIPNRKTLVINKGSRHGIEVFMPVIVPEGVVGYVYRTQAYTSEILLLTDSYSTVDALVERSRTRLLVEGYDLKNLHSTYFKQEPDIRQGDLIVASGLDKILPKGFPIGVVSSVKKDIYSEAPFVIIQPKASLNRLEEVFVILNRGGRKKEGAFQTSL